MSKFLDEGAMPGKLIFYLSELATKNPIFE